MFHTSDSAEMLSVPIKSKQYSLAKQKTEIAKTTFYEMVFVVLRKSLSCFEVLYYVIALSI